jgi:class 3 adenylate cyclase
VQPAAVAAVSNMKRLARQRAMVPDFAKLISRRSPACRSHQYTQSAKWIKSSGGKMKISRSLRKKLIAVLVATGLFVFLSVLFVNLLGLFFDLSFVSAFQVAVAAFSLGLFVSLFEEFYVQARYGRWMRAIHPLKSILVYTGIILAMYLVVTHVNYAIFGRWEHLHEAYALLPVVMPLVVFIAIAAITLIRVVGFLGAKNMLYLIIGKYHRPVLEQKIFMFLDLKGSTSLVEKLGPVETRALIGKFFFDISKPITDGGGEIYRFTGDGVVATWDWNDGVAENGIIQAIDGIRQTVADESEVYQSRFGHVPEYRIGVHGGEIVTSEEGDTKRAIGFYGETIHIAARLEQKAKELGIDCLISEDVAAGLSDVGDRIALIEHDELRGISKPVRIYEFKLAARPAGT